MKELRLTFLTSPSYGMLYRVVAASHIALHYCIAVIYTYMPTLGEVKRRDREPDNMPIISLSLLHLFHVTNQFELASFYILKPLEKDSTIPPKDAFNVLFLTGSL
jgi:hypothetical protein